MKPTSESETSDKALFNLALISNEEFQHRSGFALEQALLWYQLSAGRSACGICLVFRCLASQVKLQLELEGSSFWARS